MTALPHHRFCQEVVNQTGLLRGVAAGADLSVTVPTTPDWNLAQLLRHVGRNLRATGTAVRTGTAVVEPATQVPESAGPATDDPDALDAWLAEGAARF
ncbi:MAG: maleylpyruvate isomerase N-terminal domain-containing protein, partial [Actinomycetes bacterium]